jgi:nucleoside transporter
MFLSGAVIGVWTSAIGKYYHKLGFGDYQISLGAASFAIAAMVSSLPAGQIADRWLSSEKFMALLSGGASVLLFAARGKTEFAPLWGLLLAAALLASPVIPLGTAMSFRHLPDAPRQFPLVRVWATIGWVLGAWGLSSWQRLTGRGLEDLVILSAGLAAANAAYCLTLPATPPMRDKAGRSAMGKALGMLRDPGFAFFVAVLFVVQLFSAFFYGRGPIFVCDLGVHERDLSAVMSVGQVVEIPTVWLLPFVYARFGAKGAVAIGIGAWALRFGLFALGNPFWLMIAALSLHGICFGCGRIAATMYVDTICDRDARASAQSLLSLTIDGTGMVLGNLIAGAVADHFRRAETWDWRSVWLVPAVGCAVCLIAFTAGFRENTSRVKAA